MKSSTLVRAVNHMHHRTIVPIMSLSSTQLTELLKLQKEKETLLRRVNEIDRREAAIMGFVRRGPLIPGSPDSGRVRSLRGSVRDAILQAIREAGVQGITVAEIVAATKMSRKRVERFLFSHSAKNTPGLKKLGPALYRYLPPKGAK